MMMMEAKASFSYSSSSELVEEATTVAAAATLNDDGLGTPIHFWRGIVVK